jgi:hypothetical protein
MAEQGPHREFTRISTALEVLVEGPEGTVLTCSSRDVAMKGLFVATDKPFAPGTPVDVKILLTGTQMPVAIEAHGRVVYLLRDGMGIEFVEIVGIESFEHLRNLILFNAEQPENVEDELKHHAGIRRPGDAS